MLFIFDISVVMLSQQDLPVYRCSNRPKLEESSEHLRQVQWASTCGAQNLDSTQRCPGGHPCMFWSKLWGVVPWNTGTQSRSTQRSPKECAMETVVRAGCRWYIRVPKKLPNERPVCLFPFDLLQRDCTLLHPAPTTRQHPCGVWKTDSEIPCRTPYERYRFRTRISWEDGYPWRMCEIWFSDRIYGSNLLQLVIGVQKRLLPASNPIFMSFPMVFPTVTSECWTP